MRSLVPGARFRRFIIRTVAVCGALAALGGGREVTSQTETPDFDRLARQQSETDRAWRIASQGRMLMDKITYRSRAGELEIPAFVFQPARTRGCREAGPRSSGCTRTFAVIFTSTTFPTSATPRRRATSSSRRSIAAASGTGSAFFDAIDYGGAEVDDVVTAADVLQIEVSGRSMPTRIGIIGWSHGGLITLLSVFRNPTTFHAAVAIVPVTNLLAAPRA